MNCLTCGDPLIECNPEFTNKSTSEYIKIVLHTSGKSDGTLNR